MYQMLTIWYIQSNINKIVFRQFKNGKNKMNKSQIDEKGLDEIFKEDEEFRTSLGTVHKDGKRKWVFPKKPSGKDRKSTRPNSSHVAISYADFCLKKKINKF